MCEKMLLLEAFSQGIKLDLPIKFHKTGHKGKVHSIIFKNEKQDMEKLLETVTPKEKNIKSS